MEVSRIMKSFFFDLFIKDRLETMAPSAHMDPLLRMAKPLNRHRDMQH